MSFGLGMFLIIVSLVLVVFSGVMIYKADGTIDDNEEFSYKAKGVLTLIIAIILMIVVFVNDSDSSSSGSKGPDLYDQSTWDYNRDGTLDGKETEDYLKFRQEMEKEARRQNNK